MPDQPEIRFEKLRIEGWRQFAQVDIDLHPQLTVITGANGSGKSTLLNIFSGHFGYQRPYLSTPLWESTGEYSYFTGLLSFVRKLFSKPPSDLTQVGEIFYTNNKRAAANIPRSGSIQYQIQITEQQAVHGFHVPSHRRMPNYQSVQQIPTQPMLPAQAYAHFNNEMTSMFQGGHTGFSSTYRIKEALLAMAVFGPKTAYNHGNEVLMKAFDGFVAALKRILPEEIGFIELSIRSPDVVFVTKSGDFLIDAASGGLIALVDLAWQIYMFSLGSTSFVVTIDEPENHLHPSMQRSLMGNLLKAFPQVQFIVATHSPFIVSALRDARVYVLRYEERSEDKSDTKLPKEQTRFVSSVRLDSVNRAGTASQILRDVLGLPTTYPEWVAEGIKDIIERYRDKPFSEELLASIRQELNAAGYGDLYPDVASALLKP